MNEIESIKNLSAFGKIFYLILEEMLSSSSNVPETIKITTKGLKEAIEDQIYLQQNIEAREGIQAKVSAFLKSVSDDLYEIANLNDVKNCDTLYNAFSSYLFCSPLLIESKGQYKNFSLEDIIPDSFDTTKTRSKKNEAFSSILFEDCKRPNVYKLCGLATFLMLFLIKFNLSVEDVFYKCISMLRKKDFTFFCDSKVVLDGAITKWKNFEKKYLCEGMQYDRREVFSLGCSNKECEDIIYATSELMYLTIAWFDGSIQEESRKAINRWIDVVMGDNFKDAFDYWRYLWIRYRRLPINNLTPDQQSIYTVDNVYTLPTFYDKKGQETKHIFFNLFNDFNDGCTIFYGESGKSALIHTLTSIISMNSSYANYRGGKQMGVSSYYKNKYDVLRKELFGENDKRDIVPLIVNGEKFQEYLNDNKEVSLVGFAYYIINCYDAQLNLKGARNEVWFNKWKDAFSYEKFNSLIMGALEDRKLLVLIDGYDQMNNKNKEIFEKIIVDFISNHGSNCEVVATCYDKEKIPSILKNNNEEFLISYFNKEQYCEFMKKIIMNIKHIDGSETLNQELIQAYNYENESEVKIIEEKIETIKNNIVIPETNGKLADNILYNPLFLTNIIFKRINNDIEIFEKPFSMNELDDYNYLKTYINATINGNHLEESCSNMFKVNIFNILEKIILENKYDERVKNLFEYREDTLNKYPILSSALKILYKVSYDNGTAAQIKEYIKFISNNIG